MANDAAPESEGGKRIRAQRWYLHESAPNEKVARCDTDVTHVGFAYTDGEESVLDLKDVFGGSLPPPSVGRAAAAFGINTSAGNAGNTVGKDATAAEVREAIEARLETFTNGRWTSERAEGGPRPSMFFEALRQHRAASGRPADDAAMADFRTRHPELSEPKVQMAHLAKSPDLRAIYDKIRMDRVLAQAAKKGESVDAASLLD